MLTMKQDKSESKSFVRKLPAHAVQRPDKRVLMELVLVPQQGTLLQRHRHGRPVFGTFAAGEADAIKPPTDLTGENVCVIYNNKITVTLNTAWSFVQAVLNHATAAGFLPC